MRSLSFIFLTLLMALFLTSFAPIDKIGGNFKGTPDEMDANISDGAKKLIAQAFADVDKSKLRDYHVHIVGLDKNQGTEVNERLFKWWHVIDYAKTLAYLSAVQIKDSKNANEEYIARLVTLARYTNNKGKYHILAFDHNYNDNGAINKERSEFYTSNEYVVNLAKKYPDIFVPVISVHPYRKDAIEELTKWARLGVRFVKWLPNAQNINAANPHIDPYYQIMKKYNMVLLTHAGEEQAVNSKDAQKLGNPLLFRRPLDLGVKIIMAHCASLGKDEDLDNDNKETESFDLFLRLMDEPKYKGLLYGDISAITQFNRVPYPLTDILKRQDLHARLVNGSDYPLPAINVIIQTRGLLSQGLITEQERLYLNEIYSYNPLLFDYVLKRTIRDKDTKQGLSKVIFEQNL